MQKCVKCDPNAEWLFFAEKSQQSPSVGSFAPDPGGLQTMVPIYVKHWDVTDVTKII